MKNINITPYLAFQGNCLEAMTFYKNCLGGELHLTTFKEAPKNAGINLSEETKDKILHASLTKEGIPLLMACDHHRPGQPITIGNNVSLSISCTSRQEVQNFFNAMAPGGQVIMPLQDTFWGAYFGMLVDNFNNTWLFNYDQADDKM